MDSNLFGMDSNCLKLDSNYLPISVLDSNYFPLLGLDSNVHAHPVPTLVKIDHVKLKNTSNKSLLGLRTVLATPFA